jgi:hypothetical protein
MENIGDKGLETGGNLFKAMRKGLRVVNDCPAGGEVRRRTAAAITAVQIRGGPVAAVALAISHVATHGATWVLQLEAAHLPESRQRQQKRADKRYPDHKAPAPDPYHIFRIDNFIRIVNKYFPLLPG